MNAESIKIECEEDGFYLVVSTEDARGSQAWRITDPEALYDTVKREIGPWLYERDMAKREYLQDEYRHEVSTGQHAPFLCAVDDIDESGGYAADDPKGPKYHSTHVAIWDEREGK